MSEDTNEDKCETVTTAPGKLERMTPKARWGRLTTELPQYLIDEVKMRALKQRCSVRHILMKALRTQKFTIRDADMFPDGRGKKLR
jgi:hypothetical protein